MLMIKTNLFFECHKPNTCLHLGAFFDWTDVRFDSDHVSWDEFMTTVVLEYYDKSLDKKKHFNSLPILARSLDGVNNYLFPISEIEDVRRNICFRLWLGPNTSAVFLTDCHLLTMGFLRAQIG
jgi:hypothetical protein